MPETPAEASFGTSGIEISPFKSGLWQMAKKKRRERQSELDWAAEAVAENSWSNFHTVSATDHFGSAKTLTVRIVRILESKGRQAPTKPAKSCPPPGSVDRSTVP